MSLTRRPLGELPPRALSSDGTVDRSNYVRGSPLSASRSSPSSPVKRKKVLHIAIASRAGSTSSSSSSPYAMPSPNGRSPTELELQLGPSSPTRLSSSPSASSPMRIIASARKRSTSSCSADEQSVAQGALSELTLGSSPPSRSPASSPSPSKPKRWREASSEAMQRASTSDDIPISGKQRIRRKSSESVQESSSSRRGSSRSPSKKTSSGRATPEEQVATLMPPAALQREASFEIYADPEGLTSPGLADAVDALAQAETGEINTEMDQENVPPRRARSRSGSPLKQLSASSDYFALSS